MAKQLVLIVAVIIFVAALASFLGIGFGLSALSAAATPGGYTQCTNANDFCLYQSLLYSSGYNYDGITGNDGGVFWQVESNVQQNAQPVTSMVQGDLSTSVSFSVSAGADPVQDPGGPTCPGQPAWNEQPSYYVIQFFSAGSTSNPSAPVSVLGTVNGVQYNGAVWDGGSVLGNLNASLVQTQQTLAACYITSSGSIFTSEINGLFPITVQLSGQLPPIIMQVEFSSWGDYCDNSNPAGAHTGPCNALYNWATGQGYSNPIVPNNGGWTGTSWSAIEWQSAQASFQFIDQQKNYNGGTITAQFYTGYGGASGYNFAIDVPQPRPNGGQPDSEFTNNPTTVPNFCLSGCTLTWSIPSGASQNLSGHPPTWDTWSGVLYTGLGVGQLTMFTIINPIYAPTTPVVTWTNTGPGIYPQVNDTVDLTVFSNASNNSGQIKTITLYIAYAPPNSNSQWLPTCGTNGWVTSCNGTQIALTYNGNNAVGTYSFPVNPPLGDTLIDITAIATSLSSPSLPGYYQIQIAPSNCQAGQTCNPLRSTSTLWALIGPILMSIMIIDGLAILAFALPLTVTIRVLIIGAGVAVVFVLYYFGIYGDMFDLGGWLNNLKPA